MITVKPAPFSGWWGSHSVPYQAYPTPPYIPFHTIPYHPPHSSWLSTSNHRPHPFHPNVDAIIYFLGLYPSQGPEMSVSKPPVQLTPEITIQPPLSRRGTGPGLVLIVSSELDLGRHDKTLDPPPVQKWAEESYSVAQILVDGSGAGPDVDNLLSVAIEELKKLPECSPTDKVGIVGMFTKPPD